MKKEMTPHQLYAEVVRRAKRAKQSLRRYCGERSVNHDTVCKWKGRSSGSVMSRNKEAILK